MNYITRGNILSAIKEILREAYPEYKVYIDLCPEGFTRPCFLLQHAGTVREDVNRNTISEKVKFLLTIYEAADDYTDSSALALLETQQAVLDLFRSPALKVRDRWIRIRTEAGGREFNAAHLTLEAEYFDLRKSPEDTEDMMQEVEMKIKKEE